MSDRRIIPIAAGLLLVALVGCQRAIPVEPEADRQAMTVPQTIEDLRGAAKGAYDWALVGNWSQIEQNLDVVREDMDRLKSEGGLAGLADAEREWGAIDHARSKKNARTLGHAVNRMMVAIAGIDHSGSSPESAELARLAFDAREVQLWALEENLPNLGEARSGLVERWHDARPRLAGRIGRESLEQLDRSIAELDSAATPQEVGTVIGRILGTLRTLESSGQTGS